MLVSTIVDQHNLSVETGSRRNSAHTGANTLDHES